MPTWNPEAYLQFERQRSQPCRDLISRITLNPRTIIDLGCGTGNSTALLKERWPGAAITGLDNSPDMIERAQASGGGVEWVRQDVEDWANRESRSYDLVFANASLHWLPGHSVSFPKVFARVAEGGALAVQMPANSNEPAFRAMGELAVSPRWSIPAGAERQAREAGFYHDLLAPLARSIEIWLTTYIQVMPNVQAIADWYKGSGMRIYLDALPDEASREKFVTEYVAAITKAYPPQADGHVLFPFRRLFLIAAR